MQRCWIPHTASLPLQLLQSTSLLLDTGQVTETGLRRTPDGWLSASWALSWPEQRASGLPPLGLQAYFGGGFHHPHLRGTTVEDWPLNVFSEEDARANDPYCGRSRPVICTIWSNAQTMESSLPRQILDGEILRPLSLEHGALATEITSTSRN